MNYLFLYEIQHYQYILLKSKKLLMEDSTTSMTFWACMECCPHVEKILDALPQIVDTFPGEIFLQ